MARSTNDSNDSTVFFIDLVLRIHRALDKEAIREHVVVNDRDLVKAGLFVRRSLFAQECLLSILPSLSTSIGIIMTAFFVLSSHSQFGDLLEVQL